MTDDSLQLFTMAVFATVTLFLYISFRIRRLIDYIDDRYPPPP